MNRIQTVSIIALWIVVLVTPAGHADLSEHLLASWSFDKGKDEDVLDSSGNGHHGRMRKGETGRLPKRVNGMVGKAVRFVNSFGSDILIKRDPQLNPISGLTITAWIMHKGRINSRAEILGKKGLSDHILNGYRFYISRRGVLCLEIGDGKVIARVKTVRGTIRPDKWYFVAATFAPGRGCIYVNGRLIVDQEVPLKEIAPSNNNLVIGNFAGRRNATPYNGLIDEVNLLDVALSTDDIFKMARPHQLQQ